MEPVFISFKGEINPSSASTLRTALDGLLNESPSPSHVHLGFSSHGGVLSEGLKLFNFLDNFPIELTAYNLNLVESSAVIAFLGAKHRRMLTTSAFFLHAVVLRYENGPPTAVEMIQSEANGAKDEEAIDQILRTRLTLSDIDLKRRRQNQLPLIELNQALACGLVNEGNMHSGFPPGPGFRTIHIDGRPSRLVN